MLLERRPSTEHDRLFVIPAALPFSRGAHLLQVQGVNTYPVRKGAFSLISASPRILADSTRGVHSIQAKGQQAMLQASILRHLLWLMGFLVLLVACASPAPHSSQPSPSPSVQLSPSSSAFRQLTPSTPIPSSCPATPVYQGGPFPDELPWVQAQPISSGIVAHLVYASAANGTYRLPPKNGVFPKEGLHTKTLWSIDHPQASSEFLIDGTLLSDPSHTFQDGGNAVISPNPYPQLRNGHIYTSYISAPSQGCWRLQITSGQARGSIVMWVVG